MEGVNVSQGRAEQLAGQCEVYLSSRGFWIRTDNLDDDEYTHDVCRTGDQREEIPADAIKTADRN